MPGSKCPWWLRSFRRAAAVAVRQQPADCAIAWPQVCSDDLLHVGRRDGPDFVEQTLYLRGIAEHLHLAELHRLVGDAFGRIDILRAELLDGAREFAFADRLVSKFRDDVVDDRFDFVAVAAGQSRRITAQTYGSRERSLPDDADRARPVATSARYSREDLPIPAPPRPIGLPPERIASATKIAGMSG